MAHVRVIVADGGSTDATRAIVGSLQAEFPNLELIDNPERLQSAALNRIVAQRARPEHRVLVRCDAHATYPPGYALRVAERLVARDAAALATSMDAVGSRCFQRAAAWVVDTPLGSGGAAHRGGRRSGYVDHGHHAGFRLDWFRRVGGYDRASATTRTPSSITASRSPEAASGSMPGSGSATRCATTFSRWRGNTGSTAAAGPGRCSSIACGRACGRPSRRSTSRRWRRAWRSRRSIGLPARPRRLPRPAGRR